MNVDDLLKNTKIKVDGKDLDEIKKQKEISIDDLINEIDEEFEEETEVNYLEKDIVMSSKDVPVFGFNDEVVAKENNVLIDLDEKHSLANKIVENSLNVIDHAKKVFTSFSDDVIMGKDRSTSSKEMLIKSLEVQNQANKNLIDLARSLDGDKGNTNILIASSISPKKSGIDPSNLKNHFGG